MGKAVLIVLAVLAVLVALVIGILIAGARSSAHHPHGPGPADG